MTNNDYMEDKKFLNYAKTHRKKAGLSQNELAYLFGDKSTSFILKTERGNELPSLSRALSYQILFDVQADQMFAELSKSIADMVFKRITHLTGNLEKQPQTASVERKLEFLNSAARNIATNYSSV